MNPNIIGLKIKDRRKELGMTQPELAEKTGISQGSISRVKSGKLNPSFMAIIRICSALQMTTDELTGEKKGAEE